MKNATRFRPGMERLEEREVPAFLAPIDSPGGGDSIATGDVNEDGRDDVAVIQGKKVAVSLGTGDGTFEKGPTLSGAKGPLQRVGLHDVNGDGNLDVIASGIKASGWTTGWGGFRTRTYTSYGNVWLGNGDGTFGSVTTTTLDTFGPGSVYNPQSVTADFNRDGVVDQATLGSFFGSSTLYLVVTLRNSDGTPGETLVVDAGPNPGSIAVGDFNGDGWTDIVVVSNLGSTQPTLSVLLNDGNW